jgi:hypothetical protein
MIAPSHGPIYDWFYRRGLPGSAWSSTRRCTSRPRGWSPAWSRD